VNINNVTNLTAYQFLLTFDDTVIKLNPTDENGRVAVTPGHVGLKDIPIELWQYRPEGTPGNVVKIGGRILNHESTAGSGYLVQFHFVAVGHAGQFSSLSLSRSPQSGSNLAAYCFDIDGDDILVVEPPDGALVEIVE
jgi:hypothetical protein